jgi:hypothetical protein
MVFLDREKHPDLVVMAAQHRRLFLYETVLPALLLITVMRN